MAGDIVQHFWPNKGKAMERLICLAAGRLRMYLNNSGGGDLARKYHQLFDCLQEDATGQYLESAERLAIASLLNDRGPAGRLSRLLCQKEEVGPLLALGLCLLYRLHPSAGKLCKRLVEGCKKHPNIALVVKLMGEDEACRRELLAEEVYTAVRLYLAWEYSGDDRLFAPLRADGRLMAYLAGSGGPDLLSDGRIHVIACGATQGDSRLEKESGLGEEVHFFPRHLSVVLKEYENYQASDLYEGPPVCIITGRTGSGRKFLAGRIAGAFERDLLMVDAAHVVGKSARFREVLREVYLTGAMVCISDFPGTGTGGGDLEDLIGIFERLAPDKSDMLIITAGAGLKPLAAGKRDLIYLSIPDPDMQLSVDIWQYFDEKYLGGILNHRELAAKMKLNPGQIGRIISRMALDGVKKDRADGMVYRYCYDLLDDGRYDGIKRVDARDRMDDLQLPAAEKKVLYDICDQARCRMQVMEEWGLKDRFGYGCGVSALFTGPPGTGKTMAARVMAGLLGLELYQIDLSQVVDKYIGETQKRLEDIFSRAAQSNMILFFDEADALIGKRSEVKDAHDKYANSEVSYLLQRMEQYEGIVILASNFLQNIDAAFLRRIRFVVHFSMPDADTREKIWRGSIPEAMPSQDIDFDYLGSQFEFSGGQIKNVVLNAAFMAAGEGGILSMKYMVRAAKMELSKENQVYFAKALGKYAYLV